MPNRLRLSALAVVAFATLPVLSACSGGSSATSPGAAALIGSQRITTGQLQSQVTESLANGELAKTQGFDRATFTRELLGHLISVDLINKVAADRHVTVTAQDISQQTAEFVQQAGSLAALQTQAAQGGVTQAQLPGFIRYAALQQKIGTSLIANLPATPAQLATEYQKDIDQFDQLDIAQIAVAKKPLADHILAQVRRNPAQFATLATKDSLDTATKAQGGVVGFVGTSQVQKVVGKGVALKPGTFLVAHSSTQYVVLHIIKRKVQPVSAVTTQLRDALFASQATTLLTKTLGAEATKIGVHVSPRYGRWDNATQAVVAAPSAVSSGAGSTPSTAASSPG
ncbi:MAG TPA: peptidylprolyl isomerase [Mycobacteriales bacterium]|nr:peptidylprolyl isomerase [Mycobacteriales bacterium]